MSMLHAPVTSDQQQEDARVSVSDQDITPAVGNASLRAAHLGRSQAEARALFAPYLALASVVSGVLVAWALFGRVSMIMIGAWLVMVLGTNWFAWQRAINEESYSGSTV